MPEKLSPADRLPVPAGLIERRIYVIRGQKVMLDSDLAELYQVETKVLNQAVRRNLDRFPIDFMFQLTDAEAGLLRSQIVTLEKGRGRYTKYAPLAFTEHGVAMLSSVLSSHRAVQMSILIVGAFVKLRELLATHKDLARRIEKLETGQRDHAIAINLVAKDVRDLENSMTRQLKKLKSPARQKRRIGFVRDEK
jgi:hypothetical protein